MRNLIPLALLLICAPLSAANECAGTPYRTLGLSCAQIGLDSNRAICRAGDRYALMCDDTRHGQIRTCASNIRCQVPAEQRPHHFPGAERHPGPPDRDHRDYGSRGPRSGYGGYAVREGTWSGNHVFFQGEWEACWELRYGRDGYPLDYCGRGRINRDCRGRCERY